MDGTDVLRLREAAEFVRVNEKTLREMAKAGRVPCQRVGREWRFLKKALEGWLAGEKSPKDGSGLVSDAVGQLYLAATQVDRVPETSGFGDTAFTKNRLEPVHSWVPWIAGFSASFVGEILDREIARSGHVTVLDPFAGVGTTLVEGIRRNCDVVGFEINPYAALACQVKMDAVRRSAVAVRDAADRLETHLRARLRGGSSAPASAPPPGFRSRDPFFSPKVERQVLHALDFIREEKTGWMQRLLRVALGAVMISVSNYSYEPSLGRRAAVGKAIVVDADIARILHDRLYSMARDIEVFHNSSRREGPAATWRVFCESYLTGARSRLEAGSVDVLITSPPYLNNYHYVRNTRPQMFWLGFVEEPGDLRELEAASFGKFWQTVRSAPEIPLAFSDPELEAILAELRALHADRGAYGGAGWANYAATYFNDCARFCEVTAQVTKPGALVVVVIGNNILQGIEFKTDQIFARLAERAGFKVQGLHMVRKKRTGSSIVNSSVRVGAASKAELYETAIELRMGSGITA